MQNLADFFRGDRTFRRKIADFSNKKIERAMRPTQEGLGKEQDRFFGKRCFLRRRDFFRVDSRSLLVRVPSYTNPLFSSNSTRRQAQET